MFASATPPALQWKQGIFLSLAAFLICAYHYLPYFIVKIPNEHRINVRYLLLWSDPGLAPLEFLGIRSSAFIINKCPHKNCFVTSDRNFFADVTEFDAIVFNGRQLHRYLKGDLPKHRSERQKYVYANMESSHNYPVCSSFFDNFFNWTWTYRLDSDSRWGYFTVYNSTGDEIGPKIDMHWPKLHRFKDPVDEETIKLTDSKSKAAAWFVSNCRSLSQREVTARKVAKELNKYGHSLHIYGYCGKLTCPRSSAKGCFKKIAKDYYFYFAFENSMAADYVTEKVLTALNNYAIPVVFGAANYSSQDSKRYNLKEVFFRSGGTDAVQSELIGLYMYGGLTDYRFLPPGSYLNGYEMRPEQLAQRMAAIISSHKSNKRRLYYDFFRWRELYSFKLTADSSDVCKLCQLMNDSELMSRRSAYKDFPAWWNSKFVNCSSLS